MQASQGIFPPECLPAENFGGIAFSGMMETLDLTGKDGEKVVLFKDQLAGFEDGWQSFFVFVVLDYASDGGE